MADQDSSPLASSVMAQGDVVYGRRASGREVQFTYGEMTGASAVANAPVRGTFTATGTSTVTVAEPTVTLTNHIGISLQAANGGTVGADPIILTRTAGTGFTVKAASGDTGIYNYVII